MNTKINRWIQEAFRKPLTMEIDNLSVLIGRINALINSDPRNVMYTYSTILDDKNPFY